MYHIFVSQEVYCYFTETEIYEKLVFHYAENLYTLKKDKNKRSVLEMRKCIATMKLVHSDSLAKKFEKHLAKVIEELK